MMRFGKNLLVVLVAAAAASCLHAQVKPKPVAAAKPAQAGSTSTTQQPSSTSSAAKKPADKPAEKSAPAKATAKPVAPRPVTQTAARPTQPAAKPPANKPAKAADKKKEEKSKASGSVAAKDQNPKAVGRRDPFESLVSRREREGGEQKNLPAGKAGLQVSTLRVDGVVKTQNGMIAMVTNPQGRVYFLRDGDKLYDGQVEKISMNGIAFHEAGTDAFGHPVEHQVNKPISSSAGEKQ